MTNQGYGNQEVDIRELAYGILSSWRPILAAGICCGLLLGGYQAVNAGRQQTDPDYVKRMEEEYEDSLSLYENTSAGYEREIENIVNSVESQQEYLKESVLMQISPYDKGIATAELFVKTDYEIMPEMTFQNTDYTNALVKAYASGVKENSVLEHIAKKRNLQIRYLQELVTAQPDYENHTVTVGVAGLSEQEADALLKELLAALKSKAESFNTTVGHNEVVILSHTTDSVVDMELSKQQTQVSDSLATLQESLKTKRRELDALKEPEKPEISKSAIVKRGLRFAVIGGALGIFFMAFFCGVALLFSDRVRPGKLKRQFGLPVLACVAGSRKRWLGGIDHWLAAFFGENYFQTEAQAGALLGIRLAGTGTEATRAQCPGGLSGTLLLAGPAGSAVKEALAQAVRKQAQETAEAAVTKQAQEPASDMILQPVGSAAADPATLKQITADSAVLLVVENGRSTISQINRELEAIYACHGQVQGFVLVNPYR